MTEPDAPGSSNSGIPPEQVSGDVPHRRHPPAPHAPHAPPATGVFAPWAASGWALPMLVLAVTALRVAYLAWLCPYTLVEDEAHYWEWSRSLSMSYYSKGPGVAWLIAASTAIFGDSEFAVRLPAALCSGAGAWLVGLMGAEAAGSRRAGFIAALCWILAPMFQAIGLIMTIDGPFAACWAAAVLGLWRAVVKGARGGWVLLGAALALGTLLKFTMLLMIPAVLLTLAGSGREKRAWWWALGAVAAGLAALMPVVLWNIREGWPTLAHMLGHLGWKGGDVAPAKSRSWSYNPLWTLSLIGTQVGLVGPVLLLGAWEGFGAWGRWRKKKVSAHAWASARAMVIPAVVVYAFYLAVSVATSPEGNWALAGSISLMPLAGMRVVREMDVWVLRLRAWRALPRPRPRAGFFVRRPESPTQVLWYVAVGLGVLVAGVSARGDLLKRVPGLGWVPAHRFIGADLWAAHVQRLVEDASERAGSPAFVMCEHYGLASQMAFYLPGRPTVYCSSGWSVEGRRTQYDHWPHTDLRRVRGLEGRPAVMVGGTAAAWKRVFERVETVGTLQGDGKRGRAAFIGFGFRGLAPRVSTDDPSTP